VRVPLDVAVVPPPPVLPQAVMAKTIAAIAASDLPEPSLKFIELFSLPPVR
jgi:hypothetical protein